MIARYHDRKPRRNEADEREEKKDETKKTTDSARTNGGASLASDLMTQPHSFPPKRNLKVGRLLASV